MNGLGWTWTAWLGWTDLDSLRRETDGQMPKDGDGDRLWLTDVDGKRWTWLGRVQMDRKRLMDMRNGLISATPWSARWCSHTSNWLPFIYCFKLWIFHMLHVKVCFLHQSLLQLLDPDGERERDWLSWTVEFYQAVCLLTAFPVFPCSTYNFALIIRLYCTVAALGLKHGDTRCLLWW